MSYLYFFTLNSFLKKNLNFFNLFSNINSLDATLWTLNIRKKWIYNVIDSRKHLKSFFFFLKNSWRLTNFIQKTKNINLDYILSSYSYTLFSLLLSQGFVYNLTSFKNFIKLGLLYSERNFDQPIENYYHILNTHELVYVYLPNAELSLLWHNIKYYKFILENNYFYKKNCFFFSHNSLSIKYSLEKNYLNMSFLKLNMKEKLFVNTTVSTYLNLTNLRLYNWLIIT